MSDTENTDAQEQADDTSTEDTAGETSTDQREADDQTEDTDGSDKTYDAKYVSKLNEESKKHRLRAKDLAKELEDQKKSTADYDDIKAELDTYKSKEEKTKWAVAASKEHGVNPEVLRGSTEQEFMEHAEQVAVTMASLNEPQRKADPKQGDAPKSTVSETQNFVRGLFGGN